MLPVRGLGVGLPYSRGGQVHHGKVANPMPQIVRLLGALLLSSCTLGAEFPSEPPDLREELQDASQGCSWRSTRQVGYDPREPESCYYVYTGPNARLAYFELANICDAEKLESPVLVRPGDSPALWGYYDRSERESFEILRYQRLEACP